MGKRSSRSRKGLSTAVGTAFFIIVVMISLSSMWAIGAFQARYQEVTDKMNAWDTQRISENLNIRKVDPPAEVSNVAQTVYWYNFTIYVDNNGGVTVNIARIYVLDQDNNELYIVDPNALSATPPPLGFLSRNSTINTGEVSRVIRVSEPEISRGNPGLLATALLNYKCRIILTTDRGRQFSYSYPAPSSGAGGGGYAIVVSDNTYNFRYMDTKYSDAQWSNAWIKISSASNWNPLYKVLLNNTTTKTVVVQNGSYMLQIGQSANVVRFIVSSSSDIHNSHPTPFVTQTIPAKSSAWLFFAASLPVPQHGDWVGDPGQSYLHTSFTICFNYQGDPENRILSLPAMGQRIT